MADGFQKHRTQFLHRGIGVCKRLKICNKTGSRTFSGGDPGYSIFNLSGNRFTAGRGEIPGTGTAAEDAAAGAQSAVPVGTGKTAVQGNFVYFLSKSFF